MRERERETELVLDLLQKIKYKIIKKIYAK